MNEVDQTPATESAEETLASGSKRSGTPKNAIILVIIIAFLALLLVKIATDGTTPVDAPSSGGSAGPSITSVHNDAVADYEAAVASGKPVYVLFHSLSCDPCVEISAVVDNVMPDYDDKVVFVNAISDDLSGQQLGARFAFQYIPTSFFLSPDGTVADSFTGAMDGAQMRAYLDALIAAQ
ncbi:MAG: thioredoxin family protein [Coriobacteriia bacterium]